MVTQWQPPAEPPEEAESEWYEMQAYDLYIVTLETALYVGQLDRLPEPHLIEIPGRLRRAPSHPCAFGQPLHREHACGPGGGTRVPARRSS